MDSRSSGSQWRNRDRSDSTAAPARLIVRGCASLPGCRRCSALFAGPEVREGVVGHSIFDPGFAQTPGQPVVPVHADLQTAGQPRWHPHVAEARFFIHETEVVMQALAIAGYKIRLTALLVVPRLVCRAGFHCRENADKPRMLSPFRRQFLCAIFFSDAPGANELNLNARCRRQLFRVLADPPAKRCGEFRIVENPNRPRIQERRHSTCAANPR